MGTIVLMTRTPAPKTIEQYERQWQRKVVAARAERDAAQRAAVANAGSWNARTFYARLNAAERALVELGAS
jgi:hypothetical protein